ncbi:MAG: hypothetical protein V1724_03415, partial [Chloroflexota bacterium]
HPASERETALWGKEMSALDELLGADYRRLSNNALYRLSDELVRHRDEIEELLAQSAGCGAMRPVSRSNPATVTV